MLKKARAGSADQGEGAGSKDTSQSVLDSSRSIWLAGLGAFSRAQAEGMRMFIEEMLQQGVPVAALDLMARRNAARLLGLA